MTTVTEMKILLVNTLKLSIKTAAGYDVCTGRIGLLIFHLFTFEIMLVKTSVSYGFTLGLFNTGKSYHNSHIKMWLMQVISTVAHSCHGEIFFIIIIIIIIVITS